jgi:hypothetical protein
MKVKRNALNRGTAVYLDGSRVRFIWACGCKSVETVQTGKGRKATPIHPDMVKRLAAYWRRSGVTLPECKKHPDFYDKQLQVSRLNAENPQ